MLHISHCERKRRNPEATKQVWIASAFALRATADKSSWSLSSGAHSRDPVAPRNDGIEPEETTHAIP
jgi:hypothetical protein